MTGNLTIYPNPMINAAKVRFINPELSEYTLFIRDLSGKLVRVTGGIRTGEVEILRKDLKPGYYSIEISGPSVFRGKLIIR